ncbi:hypothetical protein Q8G48_28580, partial [Klebsiella pneumoniae]
MFKFETVALAFLVLLAVDAAKTTSAQTANGEWAAYAGDLRNYRYSPLDQISASNFNSLEVAWRFKTDIFGPRP